MREISWHCCILQRVKAKQLLSFSKLHVKLLAWATEQHLRIEAPQFFLIYFNALTAHRNAVRLTERSPSYLWRESLLPGEAYL